MRGCLRSIWTDLEHERRDGPADHGDDCVTGVNQKESVVCDYATERESTYKA